MFVMHCLISFLLLSWYILYTPRLSFHRCLPTISFKHLMWWTGKNHTFYKLYLNVWMTILIDYWRGRMSLVSTAHPTRNVSQLLVPWKSSFLFPSLAVGPLFCCRIACRKGQQKIGWEEYHKNVNMCLWCKFHLRDWKILNSCAKANSSAKWEARIR